MAKKEVKLTVTVPVREILRDAFGTYTVRERKPSGRWKAVSQSYGDKKNAEAKIGRLVIADSQEV